MICNVESADKTHCWSIVTANWLESSDIYIDIPGNELTLHNSLSID